MFLDYRVYVYMYMYIYIYYYKTQADIYTQTYIGNEKQDTSERVFARNVPYMTASSLHDIYIYIYIYIDNVKHIYIYYIQPAHVHGVCVCS